MWPDNCFLTLTYDNEHIPKGGTLVKRDMQLFMKRLRERRPETVRFYGCGEYGEDTRRPHYHLLLFNCGFYDKKYHTSNGRGEKLYTSAEVRDIWPYGHNVIGDLSFDSARYVTGYVVKKIVGKNADAAYARIDSDGRLYRVEPEFALMSRRPGVGAGYYEKFGNEVRTHDTVIVNGKEAPGTRFYDTKSELHDAAAHVRNKRKRKIEAVRNKDGGTTRNRVKEVVTLGRLRSSGKGKL